MGSPYQGGPNLPGLFKKYQMWIRCLVEGCLGEESNWTNLQVHFVHHHVKKKIVIMEEGKQPYPQ